MQYGLKGLYRCPNCVLRFASDATNDDYNHDCDPTSTALGFEERYWADGNPQWNGMENTLFGTDGNIVWNAEFQSVTARGRRESTTITRAKTVNIDLKTMVVGHNPQPPVERSR